MYSDNSCTHNYTKQQIDKAAVDKYELDKSEDDRSVEVFAPSCTILLQWAGKPGSEVTPLKAYSVMISGTTKLDTSFIIFHNPWLEKKDEARQIIKQDAVSERPVLVSCVCMHASAEVYIIMQMALMVELQDVTDWELLGVYLGLPPATLKTVKQESDRVEICKYNMLAEWLRLTPEASWENLVSALKIMKEKCVAESIEKKYTVAK